MVSVAVLIGCLHLIEIAIVSSITALFSIIIGIVLVVQIYKEYKDDAKKDIRQDTIQNN